MLDRRAAATEAMAMIGRISLALTASLMLSGCDMVSGDGARDEVIMSNVEIQPGSVSDEIVPLEQSSGDLTSVDPSTAIGPPVPTVALPEDGVADTTAARPSGTAQVPKGTSTPSEASPRAAPRDEVIAPPKPKAEDKAGEN